MKFNKKPISVRAIFGSVLASLSMRGKQEQERYEPVEQATMPKGYKRRHRANLGPHQQKMCAKRKVRRKMARKSRRVNRREAQA